MGDVTHRDTGDAKCRDNDDANHCIIITNDDKHRVTNDVDHRCANNFSRGSNDVNCSDTSDVKHRLTTDVKHRGASNVSRGSNHVKHNSDKSDVKHRRVGDVKFRDVDGGWAWVVLVASVINMSLFSCYSVTVGLYQVEFLDSFDASKGFIALVGASALSGQTLLGPVAGILTNVISARVTIIIGGVLTCLGMVFSSFAEDTVTLLVLFGLLSGIGGGLCYTPSVTIVSSYFRKYRVMANGLSLAAPGLGVIAGSYLQRWLIELHGWRYAMSITGCIMAQSCVLASLFFPHDTSMTPSCRSPCRRPRPPDSPPTPTTTTTTTTSTTTTEEQQPLHAAAEDRGLSRLKKEFSSTASIKNMVGSRTAIHVSEFGSVLLSNSVVWTVEEVTSPSMRKRTKALLNNKFMWVMCLNQVFLMAGFAINSVLFPSYAQSVGVAFHDLTTLYLVYGVTLTVGRVAGGFIFSRTPNQMLKIFFGCQLFVSFLFALLPFYGVSLPALYAFKFLLALSYGSAFLLVTPILLHYVGLEDLSVAFGCIMLCCGIGMLAAPPLGGMMYDVFGSYSVTYHMAGGAIGLGALSLLLLLLIKDLNPSVELDMKEEKLLDSERGSDSSESSSHDVEKVNGKPGINTNDIPQIRVISDMEELHDLIRECRS